MVPRSLVHHVLAYLLSSYLTKRIEKRK
jgi:hypothetical protein